jgi:hypothetical protein
MRKAGIATGAVVASVAVALGAATGAGAASSALIIGGISQPTMPDLLMAPLLGGAFKNQERVNVPWPAQAAPYTKGKTLGVSIDEGAANMRAAINAALANLSRDSNGNVINGEKVTVVGLSGGSLVVDEVLREFVGDANAPNKNLITFVLVADSSRQKVIDKAKYNKKFEYIYQPAAATQYDTIVVTGEYDGMSDFPDRPFNLLAIMNAAAGAIVMHVPSALADLSKVPAANITVDINAAGGKTTHYLVPAKNLPLVTLMPWLKPREAELKAKIDKAYSRNDIKVGEARTAVGEVPTSVSRTLVSNTVAEPVTEKVAQTAAVTRTDKTDDAPAADKAVTSKRSAAKVTDDADEATDSKDVVETKVRNGAKSQADKQTEANVKKAAAEDDTDSDTKVATSSQSTAQNAGSSDSQDSAE